MMPSRPITVAASVAAGSTMGVALLDCPLLD